MNRVVVTGMGAVCPVGNSLRESWAAAKAGLSGISRITRFEPSDTKWKVAGELKGFDPGRYLDAKEVIRLDPFVHYAVAAACMAAEDAGVIDELPHPGKSHSISPSHPSAKSNGAKVPHSRPVRSIASAGVIIGVSRGGIGTLEKELQKRCSPCPAVRTSAYLMPSTTISMASSYVALKLGAKGQCLGISNACASGTSAIGEAYRSIRSGRENLILCGGAEAPVCRICVEGYGAAGALSRINDPSASRPFDRTRDGFVLAEGACILVLEEYGRALRRGVRIYAEIIGYGDTNDAFHQTIPSAEGEARAITKALDDAGLRPADVCFVSAHGTSTPLGDRTETEAIRKSFGMDAYRVPISALKSYTGHMLAASGALEAAFTLMGMQEGFILPTLNLREMDPECDLAYAVEPGEADLRVALSQSFGFGGVNAVLVFRKIGS